MERRRFLGGCAAGVSALALRPLLPRFAGGPIPDMVVVHGKDYGGSVAAAVKALGGIGHFVKKGETVLVKPNAGWERTPEQAANTHPDVVSAVVKLCVTAGASRVIVADRTCHDAEDCFSRNGIGAAAKAAGAEVIYEDLKYVWRDFGGELVKKYQLLDLFIEADKVINVPVAKHHGLSKLTCAMKNWMGVIGGKRALLHQDIDTSVADLAAACTPSLTVVDATRVLVKNGPTGGKLEDVKQLDLVAAGYDQVTLDSWAAGLIGYKWQDVGYIVQAGKRGIGQPDPKKVKMKKIERA